MALKHNIKAETAVIVLLFFWKCNGQETTKDGNNNDKILYLENIILSLANRIEYLEGSTASNPGSNPVSNSSQEVGTTYVRWGRIDCPSTAQIVYLGYAGKGARNSGGGVDFQCLPTDPEWPTGASSGYQSNSYMYGTEYKIGSGNTPVWQSEIDNQDAPCAVCSVTVNRRLGLMAIQTTQYIRQIGSIFYAQTTKRILKIILPFKDKYISKITTAGRSRSLMIPAKETCPQGWTREYYGMLAAPTNSPSTFACIDKNLEVWGGGSANEGGGLFYVVEARCGSLDCPPYIDGYELSCVVCTM